jgi:hypothetical protein
MKDKKERKKEDKTEGFFSIIAAMLVLFTAMIDPICSAAIAILLLIAFSLYKFVKK